MRICYGILSSSTNGAIVSQLANSLGPDAPVLVHHDFSQMPDFALACGPNVRVIRDFVATRWGGWSQAEAIIRLLETAVRESTFDYFQLLSETCLPIRPLGEFSAYLSDNRPDACIGLIKVGGRADDASTLNYAWRYLATGRYAPRVIGRLAHACMDPRGIAEIRARALSQGLSMIGAAPPGSVAGLPARRFALGAALKLIAAGHPFGRGLDCYVGSTWFCLSRGVVDHVLQQMRARPDLVGHFRATRSPDESIVHTLVGNAGLAKLHRLNHFISWTERETGPDELTGVHLDAIEASGQFFARKFSKSADDPLRREMVSRQAVWRQELPVQAEGEAVDRLDRAPA